MAIASIQLWPHIRDAFGIPPELKCIDFNLHLPATGAAEIRLAMLADYDPATGDLNTIRHTFKLGESRVSREQIAGAYWSGVLDAARVTEGPAWMHQANMIALKARQEIQQMAEAFKARL